MHKHLTPSRRSKPDKFQPFAPTKPKIRETVEHRGEQYMIPKGCTMTPAELKRQLEESDARIPQPIPIDKLLQPTDAMNLNEIDDRIFTTTMIEMPIVEELPPGILGSQHLEVQLGRFEAQTLRRLLMGATDCPKPVRLKNGRFVQNSADVVRLFLEKAGGGS